VRPLSEMIWGNIVTQAFPDHIVRLVASVAYRIDRGFPQNACAGITDDEL
jgi:hypothetical protein